MPRTQRTDAERALRNLGRAILLLTLAAGLLATSIIYQRNPPRFIENLFGRIAGPPSGRVQRFSPEGGHVSTQTEFYRQHEGIEFIGDLPNESSRVRPIEPFASFSTLGPLAMELRELGDGRVVATVLRRESLDVFDVAPDLHVTVRRLPLPAEPATSGTMVLMQDGDNGLVAAYGAFEPSRVVAVSNEDGSLRWEVPLCAQVGADPSWVFSILPVRHPSVELAAAWIRGGLGQVVFGGDGAILYTSCQFATSAIFWVPEPRRPGILDLRGLLIVERPHWTTISDEQIQAYARDRQRVLVSSRRLEPVLLGSVLNAPVYQPETMRRIRLLDAADDADVNGIELLFRAVDSAVHQPFSAVLQQRGIRNQAVHRVVGFPTRRQAPVAGTGGHDLIGTRRGVLVPARDAYRRTSWVSDGSQHPVMSRTRVVRGNDSVMELVHGRRTGAPIRPPGAPVTTGTLPIRPRPEMLLPASGQQMDPSQPVQTPPGEMMTDTTTPLYSLGTRISDIQSIQRADGRWIVVAIDSQDACTLFFTLEANEVANSGEGGGS